VIGINNRDLRTFVTDLAVTRDIASHIGDRAVLVSESGIRDAADVAQVRRWGADAVLVGESLMKSDDIGHQLRKLVSA
jgi:indole-3-glycerol phosphate synthase